MEVALPVEETFGPYLIHERLGVGGMATVHRAHERGIEGFERKVALKRLLPHLAEDANFIKSFVREAKLASLLHHVNIVQIFELGRVGTQYFISMEYIQGRDLRAVLQRAARVTGPPPIHVTLGLLTQLCDALDYAHTKCDDSGTPLALIHRDISPSNLLITDGGHLKVIDFGIARAQSNQQTQTGRIKGKLAYMAPEALAGTEFDARCDLWAVGVIAHELITARPLFARKNEYETMMKVQRGELAAPSSFNQSAPPELDAIVARALARDPEHRYRSAAELREDLNDVRKMYGLETGPRDVATWLAWAFSVEAPTVGFAGNTLDGPGPASSASFDFRAVRTPAPVPSRAFVPQPLQRDEEAACELAWGDGNGERDPGVLDDVPDVRDKLASGSMDFARTGPISKVGVVPLATAQVARVEGEALDPPRSKKKLVVFASIGAAVVVAAAVTTIVMTRAPADRAAMASSIAAPAASLTVAKKTGILKFTTQPADAMISVGVLDAETRHAGSPWQVELPIGSHSVTIEHAGYKPYLVAIDLEADEKQVLRVVLEPLDANPTGDATLIVSSNPDALDVFIDGKPTGQKTPLRAPLPIGTHVITLRQNGNEVWHYSLVAKPNTMSELNATIPRPATPSAPRPGESRVAVAAAPVDREPAELPSIATATARPAPTVEPLPEAKPAVVAEAPKPDVAPIAAPAPVVKAPVIATAMIRPDKVTRLSGEVPYLSAAARATALPPMLSAKLCIDTAGRVTAATVITKVEPAAAAELANAMHAWRYSAYVANGTATPACFAVSMRTK